MSRRNPAQDPIGLSLPEHMSYFLIDAEKTASTAKRGNKTLRGNNPYAERFFHCQKETYRAFKEIQRQLSLDSNPDVPKALAAIGDELRLFFLAESKPSDRRDLRRVVEFCLATDVGPSLELTPAGHPYMPIEIVKGTRGYVEQVADQVNRCYQCGAFDACAVMVRRLLETLIIEVFEEIGLKTKIMKNGDYLTFTDLVNTLIATPQTPVGKTLKKELPKIAKVINNCAHNRAFNISESQLKQYQSDIVTAISILINLWGVQGTKT